MVVLVVVVAVGSLAVVAAEEPKKAGDKSKTSPKELTVDLGNGIRLEMVPIPAGEFLMGSPDSDKDASHNEKPQHRVRITKPFYLGKYLVTQEQWVAVMGEIARGVTIVKGPRNPVDNVYWEVCERFLGSLNAKIGTERGKFVLPTEAQWEHACRAGSTTRFSFGDDEARLGDYAWYNDKTGKGTHPVGQKKPNAWGLYDMHGNVGEWCHDWYDDRYYAKSPKDDPSGPTTGSWYVSDNSFNGSGPGVPERLTGSYRVLRGGNWATTASCCRSGFRYCSLLGAITGVQGLRVALIPADKATAAEPTPAPTKQITNSIGMKLTLVPSGEFMMGSKQSAEETAAFFNKTYGGKSLDAYLFLKEHPQHRVRITKPFYLGTYHVTRGQFRQFVADTGYKTAAETGERPGAFGWDPDKKGFGFNAKYSWRNAGFEQTDEHPVVNVSWNDAAAFCEWLSRKERKTYRLPTEAEWEYACRAGTTTRYYSGDDPETLAKVANVADATFKARFPNSEYAMKASDGYVFTAPVGSFAPNVFGLHDMHGNTWQWCSDWFGYYSPCPANDPTGPGKGDRHVLRGGAWCNDPHSSRSASRTRPVNDADARDYFPGFRVAMSQ